MKNNLPPLRARRDLSQTDLAKRAGVSRQTISNIENGKALPSVVLALNIAGTLGKALEEVFILEELDLPGNKVKRSYEPSNS